MKNTYFITLPRGADRRPVPIAEDAWGQVCDVVNQLISRDHSPIPISGQDNAGTPLVDTNVISFSPADSSAGENFVLKRVGSKLMTRVKSYSAEYDSIIAAVLLVLKRYVESVETTSTGGEQAFEQGAQYYEYIQNAAAPVVYPSQARQVTINFQWLEDTDPEARERVLRNLRALLGGHSRNVEIRFNEE